MTLLWSRPVAGFRGAALSPQGELVALCSGSKGAVSLWHWRTQPSHPLWVHPAANASNVAVGAAGATVLAWAALDPDQPEITILGGADGATLGASNPERGDLGRRDFRRRRLCRSGDQRQDTVPLRPERSAVPERAAGQAYSLVGAGRHRQFGGVPNARLVF